MNKVITINLGGNAWQLEEGGYESLRAYLETARARLGGNPDRDEILADIELAIADKFRALLSGHKNVVEEKEVATVLAEMGPVEADAGEAKEPRPADAGNAGQAGASAEPKTGKTADTGSPPRRLYKIHDGAMLAGVCNGIAAYINQDPILVRIAVVLLAIFWIRAIPSSFSVWGIGFVLLTIFWGMGLLVYIVLAIVMPEASSPEEKAAASGNPATAQEFIRRAKAGYYEAVKGFPDRQARREWRRRFRREMRANAGRWRYHWRSDWWSQWAAPAPVHPGLGFSLPLLSVLQGAVRILGICALISLLATGDIFGWGLPADVPPWIAVLLLLLVYGIFTAPLKIARHACYRHLGPPGRAWSAVFLLDALVCVVVMVALLWLAFHFSSELRAAIEGIPSLAHQAASDLHSWWK